MSELYGDQVRRLRKERGMTQRQLADAAGLSTRTLQDVEANKSERPQRDTRLKLAQVLEIAGEPDEERDDWSPRVKMILDVIAPGLETMTEEAQLRWLAKVLKTWIPRDPE